MKFTLLILILLLPAGCSDDSGKKSTQNSVTNNVDNNSTNSGTNNATNNSSNNTTGTNSGLNPGQCDGPADCNSEPCNQIANSATYCGLPLDLSIEECQTPDETNECCDDSQCTDGINGRCISAWVGYCGGVGPGAGNECRYDECQVGTDCPDNQACAPAGTFGRPVNTCVIALCEQDADCTDGVDGQCALVHTSDTCPEPMLGCTYQGDACRAAYQCDNGQVCVNGSCLTELATP